MAKVICSKMNNGADYLVENQKIDDKNWIFYGKLAGGMPGVGKRLVFVAAYPESQLEVLDGTTHSTLALFKKRAKCVLEGRSKRRRVMEI